MTYDLEDVSGIGKATAEKMRAAGFDTVEKLASSTPEDLIKANIKGIGRSTAIKYINSAKSLLEKIQSETAKKASKVKEEIKEDEKLKEEASKKVEKPSIDEKKISELKKLIKTQAECNIGLVGHVDHGIKETIRLIP